MSLTSSPLSSVSAGYVENLYAEFRRNPASVDDSWRCLFGVLDLIDEATGLEPATGGDGARIARLAEAVRNRGHLLARLNPLAGPAPIAQADALADHIPQGADSMEQLTQRYCGTLTVETAHIDDAALRNWLIAAFEAPEPAPAAAEQVETLKDLIQADEFERFLGRKFPTKKRFGAEGAEAVITLLRRLLHRAAETGVTHVVIGTMHRGRLNIMTNLLGRSPARLFAEIKGAHPFPTDAARPGDVPYHLGYRTIVETGAGGLDVTLLANPSHLEAIDPVVAGQARAQQDLIGPDGAKRVLPIVLHTDAAVIAQGIVSETLQLGAPEGFSVGGTVHVVINNQIGFTTEQHEARTSTHCTGGWKAIDSCILHVNADDPAAVRRSAGLALDWRQAHGRDAVIDFVCYRRNGHNEIDEPTFTQPLLYQSVAAQEPVATAFARRLVAEGLVTQAEVDGFAETCRDALQAAYEASPDFRINDSGYPPARTAGTGAASGFDPERLRVIADELARAPAGMAVHARMNRILRQRVIGDQDIAWPTAEALAFGSLLTEGVGVRLTGQDVVRGAFSHRHFGLVDGESGVRHVGLSSLSGSRAAFAVHNSPLSEYAVLGFEYGYSLENTGTLVIWEAQFGDFANGAQIIIDQFITAAEDKWCAPSNLVVLLPHGLEGQGPEHSSARLERYLLMAARNNIRIVHPSTPANYFHLLRRQAHAAERKPLIVMSPKRLLRLPAAVSPLSDFGPDTGFEPVIVSAPAGSVSRVLLCTGKVAYDLEAERERRGAADVAIVRLEELYPLAADALSGVFRQWPDAPCVWVQEEPSNMGAWGWLDRRVEELRREAGARTAVMLYAGRPEAASPAGSFHDDHDDDQRRLVESAFTVMA
ncbi:MAG TPA: 2-oxoglutarate dehydrogenase E1 component [Acetobacteraceae bacterium]|jgi:2-oxoglutarate dehydrogenase E1 component|nr:2-oxoglutarate dehydrogenase E1 component [Acetobacteraceae bacterium]